MEAFRIILFYLLSSNLINSQDLTNKWYMKRMSSAVVPPYKRAYTIIQKQILNPLMNGSRSEFETDEAAISLLAKNSQCAAKNVHYYLDKALSTSQRINKDIEDWHAKEVSAVSEKQNQINQVETNIQRINDDIRLVEILLAPFQEDVRQKEHYLNLTTNKVRKAQSKVAAARHCNLKRSVGTWLKENIVEPIQNAADNGAIKLLCNVFNSKIVDIFRNRQSEARKKLALVHQRASPYNQRLTNLRVIQSLYNELLSIKKQRLNSLKLNLIILPDKQIHVTKIINQLKLTVNHLENINSTSNDFVTILKKFVEFDVFIDPLNRIYDEMLKCNAMSQFPDGRISSETITKARIRIDKLTVIPSTIPVVKTMGEEKTVCTNETLAEQEEVDYGWNAMIRSFHNNTLVQNRLRNMFQLQKLITTNTERMILGQLFLETEEEKKIQFEISRLS
ncbi:unnamed protein product [Didymodactylos carnosus]|uniref:Uncharacterized protein n=1 Tax=Didymodactylos carnosus TaxID=1234261 RepID=A0A813YN65_9BILA|nr:unnamed protein product [Didymodactylos carnosus]CAF3671827.1 unnamed protein product [Didymodactylos carnosus]